MSRVEDVLIDTLRDPSRGLPPWPDPVRRVRAARRERRRRRLLAASATALVLGAAVAVPAVLRAGEKPRLPVAGTPGPVAVVDGHFTPPTGHPAVRTVVEHGGEVYAGAVGRGATAGAIWQVTASGRALAGVLVARAAPLQLVSAGGQLWHLASSDVGPPKVGPVDEDAGKVTLGSIDGEPLTLAGDARSLYIARRALAGGPVHVERRDPATGRVEAVRSFQSAGTPRLALDGEVLWVRTGELSPSGGTGGSRLTKLDAATLEPLGTVLLPGSLVEGAIAAGRGRVWVVVAETTEIMTTVGAVLAFDSSLEVVHEIRDTAFPLELAYADGSVWLSGSELARADAATGRLTGTPIDLPAGATAPLVHGGHLWVGGDDGLTRYAIRPA